MCLVSRATRLTLQFSMSCHAVVKMAAKLINCTKEEQRSVIRFCGQKVCWEHKFISVFVLGMGIKFSLVESSMSGLKSSKMAARL